MFLNCGVVVAIIFLLSLGFSRNASYEAIVKCTDEPIRPACEMRGNFWVLYNFVSSAITFRCHETVTYTTHADYSFLDNVEELVDRWNGPISVAVYAPGTDFGLSLTTIAYLRNCRHSKIKEFVTFHVFFDSSHFPNKSSIMRSYRDSVDCRQLPPYSLNKSVSYRHQHNLTYPINAARNIARISAQTYYIFASDVELYPVFNFPRRFLNMILKNPEYHPRRRPAVYVLPVFEVTEHSGVPKNKLELQKMLGNGTAKEFHINLCSMCHRVPHIEEWIAQEESENFNVFVVTNRTKKYRRWEPFYVGTQSEPLFDERLTWEGQSNKITQAYAMCLLGYNYMVLDNAFLVHRPGIKKSKDQLVKHFHVVSKTNTLIRTVIRPELIKIYGKVKGCAL